MSLRAGSMVVQMSNFELSQSLVHLLHRASQTADEIFSTAAGVSDLTPRQFAVLAIISEYDGLSQTKIVEMTGIDRSTMADIVRRLKLKGLIGRQRSRLDARSYSIKLSNIGRKSFESAMRDAKVAETRLETYVPGQQTNDLVRLLQSLLAASARNKKA